MEKLILTTLILLGWSVRINAQVTYIPDPNFEQALINYGLDNGTIDGQVATVSIDTVTILNVNNYGIADMTGVEDFVSLRKLWSVNNSFTGIDVSNLVNLEWLSLGNGNLSSLDVSNNPNLEVLECAISNLSALDLSANTSLKILQCFSNNISYLDLSNCPDIQQIKCNLNDLDSISFNQNIMLSELYCGDNNLTQINLSQTPNLMILDLSGNLLSTIDVSYCQNLETFSITGTNLTELDLSQNPNLVMVNCSYSDLVCLNVKNGNNSSITSFSAENNSNLACIEVNDVNWATNNWTIDATASFNTYCNNSCSLGVHSVKMFNVDVFPNPTQNYLNLQLDRLAERVEISILNYLGQTLESSVYSNTSELTLSMPLNAGVYFLKIALNEDEMQLIRVLKE
ncbi:leucine-rich repeat domain-containing protein [Parvicella tangerina]|uniref:Secretion system C-terminal sorting domain-containing protein n=1 Tax=Parvicella tangerina TaxID=2829795 RepID=A0A916NH42_9FLAO|nr:T9SS type A sorting domain-containing protein [Parvicella tangerina]CAG5082049.1 hypothetical protein CRYO30217_01794 [Parvicella tangerina]